MIRSMTQVASSWLWQQKHNFHSVQATHQQQQQQQEPYSSLRQLMVGPPSPVVLRSTHCAATGVLVKCSSSHHSSMNHQSVRYFSSYPPHEIVGLPSLSPVRYWNLSVLFGLCCNFHTTNIFLFLLTFLIVHTILFGGHAVIYTLW
jgi:hypothetical protein